MEYLLARRTISITELKRSPSAVIEQAGDEAIAVLNHNKPAAYLLSAATYNSLLEKIEAASIREAIAASRSDSRASLNAEQVFDELNTEINKIAAENFGK